MDSLIERKKKAKRKNQFFYSFMLMRKVTQQKIKIISIAIAN